MTPEARERRRIRTPVLVVTAAAWATILLADPLGSLSGSRGGSASGAGVMAHAGHADHSMAGAMPPGTEASPEPVTGLLIGGALMLLAMMTPLLIPALRHVHTRSLRSRRWRAVTLVTIANAAVWTVGALLLVAVAAALRSVTGRADLALLLGLVAAVSWQLSPLKQYCLNRHCAHPPIASFGAAADRDALRFGGTHAVWSLGSCWALMLLSLLTPAWHLTVMLVVSVWMWVEPLDRPERPSWRVRVPMRFLRIAGTTLRSWQVPATLSLGAGTGAAGRRTAS